MFYPNFAPCEFLIHGNGEITETKTGKTTDTDKQMIENSENCVDLGYSIGRHDKTNELCFQTVTNSFTASRVL
jgi:hypothetical protein